MQAFLGLLKKAVGAVAMYFIKKYAAEFAYDETVKLLGKLAKRTDTTTDDEMVAKLKHDRDDAIAIIKGIF